MDIDALYEAAPGEFVRMRDALLKQLRKAGDAQAAPAVKALRRPSTAAWTVNQLVRRYPAELERLLRAGDRVRDAHTRADVSSMRRAGTEQREATSALLEKAAWILSKAGHDSGPLDKVRETLDAAALDPESRERVRAGRLERELRHVGFGDLPVAASAPSSPAAKVRKRAPDERLERKARELEGEAGRLEREVDEAEAVAREARRRAGRARQAAKRAREAAERDRP